MFFEIPSDEYQKYVKFFDLKSLLGITYFRAFLLVFIAAIVGSLNIAVPDWLKYVRAILIAIPVFITLLGIIIVFVNGFFRIISRIFNYKYEDSQLAKWIDNICQKLFPKKLYTASIFSTSKSRTNNIPSIYYGVILNIFIFAALIIGIILRNYKNISINQLGNNQVVKYILSVISILFKY